MLHLSYNPTTIITLPLTVGVTLVCVVSMLEWVRKSGKKYPPGPKGIPFFGNLFQLSRRDFEEFGHKYGDMAYLKVFGQGILLLNSHVAAVDLLDRKSTIYSNRPSFVVINTLTRGLFLGVLNYGDSWRRMRRGGHECFRKASIKRYHSVQEREALLFTDNLLKDARDWHQEVSRMAISMFLSTVYDLPATLSAKAPIIEAFNKFDHLIIDATFPGRYLVEFFSWMKFLPSVLLPWKKKMANGFHEFSALFDKLFLETEEHMNHGDEKPGIAGYVIREKERLGLTRSEAVWLPATFANGSASITEAVLWFFLAMVAFPDHQKRCQVELDTVVGRSRMPTMEDAENLPYMKATLKELLRWRPTSPLGTQHVTKEDDWYKGRFIPKGTMCFAHIWLMNRDKRIYGEDAEDFNPGRFLNEEGKFVPIVGETKDGNLESEGHVAYGFGPRICPGRYYANDALFIIFARLLWTATISPVIDKDTGKSMIPDLRDTVGNGITIRPPSFDIHVKHRFPEAVALMNHTKELLA